MPLESRKISGPDCSSILLTLAFLLSFSSPTSAYDQFSVASRCPPPCQDIADHSSWSLYRDVSQLDNCNQTVLLDLNLNHGVDSTALSYPIRACSVTEIETTVPVKRQSFSFTSSNGTNSTSFDAQSETHDLQIVRWLSQDSTTSGTTITSATSALAQVLESQKKSGTSIFFAKLGKAFVGVYAGSQIDNQGLGSIVQQFVQREAGYEVSQMAAQLCDSDSLGSQILGIYVDTTGDLDAVKSALGGWNNATCLGSGRGETETWPAVTIAMVSGKNISVGPSIESRASTNKYLAKRRPQDDIRNHFKRATCSYTQAVSGDGCYSVAERCAITQAELISYNNDANLCSDLQVGQYVCCSSGTLPDFTPQPNSDGTCYSYTVVSGDYCSAIAETNSLTVADIESRNTDTWGWAGCSYLLVGAVICLSAGTPPMPAAVANSVCGPTVVGTARPADMSTLADLNPCPLNACCDVWGQCGITQDFCVPTPADTGAPGTALPGTNGCVSGCNMEITNNAAPPATFLKVGYWEAFNSERPCLHMEASQIDTTEYTHVHFAFLTLSATYDIDVGNLTSGFADFKALTGVKRIVSFGGWSFSTDYDTYPIFRETVTAEEREAVATKLVAFVADNDLDGLDFDWEYPGAPDIPNLPPGSPSDGPNYLTFLQLVRAGLPAEKTVSLAAPASFWYLQGFPIAEMSLVVDYIVYMTYDLHGQWDYGNSWSDDGCTAGNCLRSHVNKTETASALAMITHAGVQASKVVVGMALYGRSFEMTTAGCYGEQCTYVGPDSGATPGKCTLTAGYISNYEIRDIMETNSDVQQYSSDDYGDILVYDSVQWVSWMTKETFDSRVAWVKGLNFGGTVDWAMDLDADYDSSDAPGGGDNGGEVVIVSPGIYTDPDPVIQCYPPCTLVLPPFVLATATTISMEPVTVTYKENWSTTLTISGAFITTSAGSTTSTVITLPPITTNTIYVSNVVWDPSGVLGVPTTITTTGANGAVTTITTTKPNGVLTTLTSTGSDGKVTTITSTVNAQQEVTTLTTTGSDGKVTTITSTASSASSTAAAGIIYFSSSIIPPPVTLTQTNTDSTGSPVIWTYSPGPYPTPSGDKTTPVPPPPGFPTSVNIQSGAPTPTCLPTEICGIPCVLFCSSGSDCVICGCIGPFCPSGTNCVGAGCTDTGAVDGSDPDDETCTKKETASYCDVDCTVIEYPLSTTTTCNDPDCTRTITACTATDSTTTSTTTIACATGVAYVDANDDDLSEDWGVLVDLGTFDIPAEVVVVTTTSTLTLPPTTTTVTQVVVVQPTASADCTFWDTGFFYQFEVYNIQNWVTDGGAALKKQEKGCAALTGWSWTDATNDDFAYVYFNLPFIFKAGCVERAIVSAGGPKISCVGGGIGYTADTRKRDDGNAINSDDETDVASSLGQDLKKKRDRDLAADALRRASAEESEKMKRERIQKRATTKSASYMSLTETPTYTYASDEVSQTYIPMTWDDNDTVVLTWTLTETDDVSLSTFVYTTLIAGYTYMSNITTSFSPSSTLSAPSNPFTTGSPSTSMASSSTATSTSASATSIACTTATINFSLSGADASAGNMQLVGSAPELGVWVFEDSIPMTLSGSTWRASVSFEEGDYTEYKYYWISNEGTVTWSADPNYSVVAALDCSSATSVADVWT